MKPEPTMQAGDAHTMVDVIRVNVLAPYVLELAFDDGSVKLIDIEDRLTGPDFAWLLDDYDAFKQRLADRLRATEGVDRIRLLGLRRRLRIGFRLCFNTILLCIRNCDLTCFIRSGRLFNRVSIRIGFFLHF